MQNRDAQLIGRNYGHELRARYGYRARPLGLSIHTEGQEGLDL
jgi:hypothetical protein